MHKINSMYEQFKHRFNFVFVYIIEAHAQDEWPICSARWSPTGKPILYNQTRTLEDRTRAASDFARDFKMKMPIIMDDMDNSFEKHYAPWPFRIFIVDPSNTLLYKSHPSENIIETVISRLSSM